MNARLSFELISIIPNTTIVAKDFTAKEIIIFLIEIPDKSHKTIAMLTEIIIGKINTFRNFIKD